MTRDEFVNQLIDQAKAIFPSYWKTLPDDQRLRLSGMESELGDVSRQLLRGLWTLVGESLDALGVEVAGYCEAGCRRERRKDSVAVDVLGQRVEVPCTYFYCRRCHQGASPVRRWLGVESGGVSLGVERAVVDLTTRMTFGDATDSMREHHGQNIDRTKAERITYDVAREAESYLANRRHEAREKLRGGEQPVVEQLVFTADGGAIPVGTLSRPDNDSGAQKTEVRKLAKGTRTITGREARFIATHAAGSTKGRVVDCHIAPYDQPEYTGARMFAAAALAGLSDRSHIHGVFDMGSWIHSQFEEQFFTFEHSACADIMHVAGYLIDAGRVLVGEDKATAWGMEHKRRMLGGEFDHVLARLQEHACASQCQNDERGTCLVRVAERYLVNNRAFMEHYQDILNRDLPVGSGEAESGIRHIIKRRMSVAGAWKESNAALVLALLAIRASGYWDDFWAWRTERDRADWRARQDGGAKVVFRNQRRGDTMNAAA